MNNWEKKALNFINQTSRWDKEKDISSFLSFSISLVKELTNADIALQIELEDNETAKVKNASPNYLNDLVMNPEPIRKAIYTQGFKTIYWKEIPSGKDNAFSELLQALSSAVIIPMNTTPGISLLIMGWSEPQGFGNEFIECVETIRLRLKEILIQSQQQLNFQRLNSRFTAILHTIPHALVFISNDGYSGWVNQKAAALLKLSNEGEQLPVTLSEAMTQLRNQATNLEDIYREAARLFQSPDNAISDWNWQLEATSLKVSCLPVKSPGVNGRLWIFE